MPPMHIFFIADGERLEWQSWLLATSLANTHRDRDNVHLHAYAGADWMPRIGATTRAIYEAAGVTLRSMPVAPEWAKPYPHGNKIAAATDRARAGGRSERAIFLDTDMICLRPLTELADLPDAEVAAAPEGRPTWGPDDRWARAYAHYDLPVPTGRVRLLRGKRQAHVPYFNAGLVAFSEAEGPDGKTFAEHWLETALDFDHNCSIANKRPWLDQITLPLTMARFGYTAHVLDESYNYSLSHREDYSLTPDAHLLHYHRCRFLEQAPEWPAALARFWDVVPQAHHSVARQGLCDLGLAV